MAYTKTTWLDRAVQFANRYLKSGETSAGVTLTADPGTVTQAGTPLNAGNLNKIEQGIADAHATLSRTATLVVAASNSTAAGKAAADYVCTGTDDQTIINNAITALPANGGKIILLEGTFSVNTTPSIAVNKSNVTIEGQGRGTVIQFQNAASDTFNSMLSLSAGVSYIFIRYVTFSTVNLTTTANSMKAIDTNLGAVNYVTLDNCIFIGNTLGSSSGVAIQGSHLTLINNLLIDGGALGIPDTASYVTIANNRVIRSFFDGINISNANTAYGKTHFIVRDNLVVDSSQNGIMCGYMDSGEVIGNYVIGSGRKTNITYDNIAIIGSKNLNVQHNTCRLGSNPNTPRYGLRIAAQGANVSSNIWSTNNDLAGSGTTGAFSDAGTGTITTAGNKLA